jgi:hypothetical protein
VLAGATRPGVLMIGRFGTNLPGRRSEAGFLQSDPLQG